MDKLNEGGWYVQNRLVVQGWPQVPGINYGGGTFASVCRFQSIRMMLAITAKLEYEIYMIDAQTAFLNADVEKEVFVKMPWVRARQQGWSSLSDETSEKFLWIPPKS